MFVLAYIEHCVEELQERSGVDNMAIDKVGKKPQAVPR